MSTIETTFSIRETATCPCCHLYQYTTTSGQNVARARCRRCDQPLGIAYYKFQLLLGRIDIYTFQIYSNLLK